MLHRVEPRCRDAGQNDLAQQLQNLLHQVGNGIELMQEEQRVPVEQPEPLERPARKPRFLSKG